MFSLRFLRSRAIETLVAANAFMFFLTLVLPRRFILEYLALTPDLVFSRPWTLLTSMFIHGDFMHILFNMFTLFFLGTYLERFTSTRDFLKVYFVGGFVGSVAYIVTSPIFGTWSTPAIGASGAVFAVIGALVVLRPHMTILVNLIIPMPLWLLALIYTLIAITSMGTGMGEIAENAHMGGLIAGMIFGYYFKNRVRKPKIEIIGYKYY